MADKMITYVDSKILYSIKISLHFDDNTVEEKTYSIGDAISIDYVKDRELFSIQGVLKKITTGNILVIDASTVSNSLIANIPVDNVRRLKEITPVTEPEPTVTP